MAGGKNNTSKQRFIGWKSVSALVIFSFLFIGTLYFAQSYFARRCSWKVSKRALASTNRYIKVSLDNALEIFVDREDQALCRRVNMLDAYVRLAHIAAKRLIKAGDHVLDIGAGYGEDSHRFARMVGSEGKVSAFEVDPMRAHYFKRSLKLNKLQNVTIYNQGLSEKDFTASLVKKPQDSFVVGTNKQERFCQKSSCSLVRMTMLDHALPNAHVDFIHIDVNRYEPSVLKGAAQILAMNPEITIMMKWHPKTNSHHQENVDELVAFFQYEKFNLWVIDSYGVPQPAKLEELFDATPRYVVLSRQRAL